MGETKLRHEIGSKIRKIRIEKDMSQTELAKACKFEKASMSRIESGQANPTISTLFKISKALDVDIAVFFNE